MVKKQIRHLCFIFTEQATCPNRGGTHLGGTISCFQGGRWDHLDQNLWVKTLHKGCYSSYTATAVTGGCVSRGATLYNGMFWYKCKLQGTGDPHLAALLDKQVLHIFTDSNGSKCRVLIKCQHRFRFLKKQGFAKYTHDIYLIISVDAKPTISFHRDFRLSEDSFCTGKRSKRQRVLEDWILIGTQYSILARESGYGGVHEWVLAHDLNTQILYLPPFLQPSKPSRADSLAPAGTGIIWGNDEASWSIYPTDQREAINQERPRGLCEVPRYQNVIQHLIWKVIIEKWWISGNLILEGSTTLLLVFSHSLKITHQLYYATF